MSLSAHFLKYATMATYLQPKLSEVEIIEAIRFHYPDMHIQKVLLSVQSKNNLLERIEVMENHESYLRTANMKKTPTLEGSNSKLNQRRVQRQPNQRNDYDQSIQKRNYYLSESETQPKNTRTISIKSNHEENEYTPMRNSHSGRY
jgi:hypothetical protein